jgi:hypothetical protein
VRNATQNAIKPFSALLILTSLAWATDLPWKGKPYEQWTDKDVERVFTDSPWARTTTITRTWHPLTQKDLPNPTVSHTARTIPNSPGPGTDTRGTESNIDVYWASSRVMRAASARKDALRGNTKGVDVEKYANEPQDEYQIVVQSDDMAPFFRHDENFFQANAFLEANKTNRKSCLAMSGTNAMKKESWSRQPSSSFPRRPLRATLRFPAMRRTPSSSARSKAPCCA